jgi:hypothetical protein
MTATADVCAQQASSDSGLEEVLVTTKRGNETIRTIINPPDLLVTTPTWWPESRTLTMAAVVVRGRSQRDPMIQ